MKQIRIPQVASLSTKDLRRKQSYLNEVEFYKIFSSQLTTGCRVAAYYASIVEGKVDFEMKLLLEDLSLTYPVQIQEDLGLKDTISVLKWMASFHASFWGTKNRDRRRKSLSKWERGGYWFLSSRLVELESIRCSHPDLHRAAPLIDEKLKELQEEGRYETLLHGDLKSENILFSSAQNDRECAVYDFQYVGSGLGASDLAYFLVSSVQESVLSAHFSELCSIYHSFLIKDLESFSAGEAAREYTMELLLVHLDWAILDFYRFLAGWGLWGNHRWAWEKTKYLLLDILYIQ